MSLSATPGVPAADRILSAKTHTIQNPSRVITQPLAERNGPLSGPL